MLKILALQVKGTWVPELLLGGSIQDGEMKFDLHFSKYHSCHFRGSFLKLTFEKYGYSCDIQIYVSRHLYPLVFVL
ncbi:hypothetical protein E5288_WYG017225 [Bos mutus]|uniref:Uncharacterized protein n=1 Tax=Bos mutus TaxID=72004 RepID=A0A6B0SBR1_9CETA|nr:hypothetical protein [Bos mutus]